MHGALKRAALRRPRHNSIAFEIRKAGRADIPAMRVMQERSFRILGSHYYMRDALEAFLNFVGTMDDAVVDEGHCFVAVDAKGAVIGSGARSNLVPGYARHIVKPHAAAVIGSATVRSVFVAPECTRRGIAQAMMRHIETDAAASGVYQLQLTAALSGEAFYRAMGYAAEPRGHVALPDGTRFGCVRMRKSIVARSSSAA